MSQNIRKELTEKFVAAIESGCPPWRAGWSMASPPMNPSTGKAYNGMNRLLLMQAVADANGDYRFEVIDPNQRYTVVSYDHKHLYRAVIADNLQPHLMP